MREVTTFRLGIAWAALCAALGLHILDEALTHFLSIYNPTVIAMRAKLGFDQNWGPPISLNSASCHSDDGKYQLLVPAS